MDNVKCRGKKSDPKKDIKDYQPNPSITQKPHPFSTKPNRAESNEAKVECITKYESIINVIKSIYSNGQIYLNETVL